MIRLIVPRSMHHMHAYHTMVMSRDGLVNRGHTMQCVSRRSASYSMVLVPPRRVAQEPAHSCQSRPRCQCQLMPGHECVLHARPCRCRCRLRKVRRPARSRPPSVVDLQELGPSCAWSRCVASIRGAFSQRSIAPKLPSPPDCTPCCKVYSSGRGGSQEGSWLD